MKKRIGLALITLASVSLFSCSENISKKVLYFNTTIDMDLYSATQTNSDYILSYFSTMSDLTDAYNEPLKASANLYTINHTNDPVVVDDKLRDILQFAIDMQKETEGYFNPLVGKLTSLWKDGINGIVDGVQTNPAVPYIPSDAAIKEALDETNSSTLTIVGNTVTRTGRGVVDLGALAKGYALREVRSYIKKQGISKYIINAGTSSIALGAASEGGKWKVSFSDYNDDHREDGHGAYFYASDTCIGTSSINPQGATINGKNYSHIVNPFTGSAEASYIMATVKYDDPGICDVLSTVFMLIGEEKAKAYLQKYDGLSYTFYDGSKLSYSDNMGVEEY